MQPAKVDAWNRSEFIHRSQLRGRLLPGPQENARGINEKILYKRRREKKENEKEKEVSLFKEEQGGTTYILKPCVLGE